MIVTDIRAIVEAAPDEGGLGWRFMAQGDAMANVRADSAAFPLVYFDVYRVAKAEVRPRWRVTETVELYFMALAPAAEPSVSALDREGDRILAIQAELLEAARKFVRLWNAARPHRAVSTLNIEYPPPMFDANEVSLCLRIDIKEDPACL